jgi:hypothetical protein
LVRGKGKGKREGIASILKKAGKGKEEKESK